MQPSADVVTGVVSVSTGVVSVVASVLSPELSLDESPHPVTSRTDGDKKEESRFPHRQILPRLTCAGSRL